MITANHEELRGLLVDRLREECANDLADKLAVCGSTQWLTCLCCGNHRPIEHRCKLRWCPVCQRMISARRVARYATAIAAMQWPLAVVLTVPNSVDPDSVRDLKEKFRRLRNRKMWRSKVAGGVAGIEITNQGRGWHPHLHSINDCRWLSVTVPEPLPSDGARIRKMKLKAAQAELVAEWSSLVGVKHTSVWIKRIHGASIAVETLKYSCKGSDLVMSPDPVAPLIRTISRLRLVTSYGSMHGLPLDDDADVPSAVCDTCQMAAGWMPSHLVSAYDRWSTHYDPTTIRPPVAI